MPGQNHIQYCPEICLAPMKSSFQVSNLRYWWKYKIELELKLNLNSALQPWRKEEDKPIVSYLLVWGEWIIYWQQNCKFGYHKAFNITEITEILDCQNCLLALLSCKRDCHPLRPQIDTRVGNTTLLGLHARLANGPRRWWNLNLLVIVIWQFLKGHQNWTFQLI